MSLLHTEHRDSQGRLVLFRCTDCGNVYLSLGSLHAHVESHWSLLGSLRWHWTHWFRDEPAEKWMRSTEIVAVEAVEPISMEQVDA